MSRVFALMAALLLLAGCTISRNEIVQSGTPEASVDLRSGAVYVYSFLDLREGLFGPTMLAVVNRQIVDKLSIAGVRATVLPFKQSAIGRYYPVTRASAEIPINQVIAANARDEAALSARYRLIIFPQSTETQGAWFVYDIRWDLIDIKANRTVWTAKTHGSRLIMWTADEEPEGRAATIADSLLNAMKSAKIL